MKGSSELVIFEAPHRSRFVPVPDRENHVSIVVLEIRADNSISCLLFNGRPVLFSGTQKATLIERTTRVKLMKGSLSRLFHGF